MNLLTPVFSIARIMFFVPFARKLLLSIGGRPSVHNTTSCPCIARSTEAKSNTFPFINCNFSCFWSSFSGLRANAVTSCPCSRACVTTWRPVLPVEPKIINFIFSPCLFQNIKRLLLSCMRGTHAWHQCDLLRPDRRGATTSRRTWSTGGRRVSNRRRSPRGRPSR